MDKQDTTNSSLKYHVNPVIPSKRNFLLYNTVNWLATENLSDMGPFVKLI